MGIALLAGEQIIKPPFFVEPADAPITSMIAGHIGVGQALGQTARGGDGIIDMRHAHEAEGYSLVWREVPGIFLMQAQGRVEHCILKALNSRLDWLQKGPPQTGKLLQAGRHVLHPAGVLPGKGSAVRGRSKHLGGQTVINKANAKLGRTA